MEYSEWLLAALIAIAYMVLLAVTELWHYNKRPPIEVTRKFAHVVAGVVSMSFSYLFESHWTVFALVLTFTALMVATKEMGWLRSIHAIKRPSKGSLYFPLAIYVTFVLSSVYDAPLFYTLSLLVLAVSDSLAALIGKAYGVKRYFVQGAQQKSIEGSIVFFLATFLILLIGLLLAGTWGRTETILCALLAALVVSAIESISWNGSDNLLIPLSTWLMLNKSTPMQAGDLLLELALLSLIFVLFLTAIRLPSPRLSVSALIGVTLLGYGAWSLVNFNWFLPIAIGAVLFSQSSLLFEQTHKTSTPFQIRPIFYVTVLPSVWILLADQLSEWQSLLLVPFIVSLVSQFSLSWRRNARMHRDTIEHRYPWYLTRACAVARALILTVLFIPLQCALGSQIPLLYSLIACFLGILLVDRLYWAVANRRQREWSERSEQVHFFRLSLAIRSLASGLVLVGNMSLHFGWL